MKDGGDYLRLLRRNYPRRHLGSKLLAWVLVTALLTPLFCTLFIYAADAPEGTISPTIRNTQRSAAMSLL